MSFSRRLMYGLLLAGVFFLAACAIGFAEGKRIATLSLIGTSVVLEAQPAAVASLPLRFDPFSGAVISILGNLIAIPVLMLTFHEIVLRWNWFKRKLQKAEKWSQRYGKYGVWVLIPFCPVLGAYVCIGVGYVMRWSPRLVFLSVLIGIIVSTFVITYGGDSVIRAVQANF